MAVIPISADVFATWMLASDALALVKASQGAETYSSLLSRLAGSQITAYAETATQASQSVPGPSHISSSIWQVVEGLGNHWSQSLWTTNDMVVTLRTRDSYGNRRDTEWRFYSIRLDPVGVQKMLPKRMATPQTVASTSVASLAPPPLQTGVVPPPLSKGGRPRKDYWDLLWAFICAQIYSGKLEPNKQATIEKAMLDWASAHGHELSEQAARSRARILIAALTEEDKN